jgi:hypothetical protein
MHDFRASKGEPSGAEASQSALYKK